MKKTIDEAKELLNKLLLTDNPPILFLGAGFSQGAENYASSMDGKDLKSYIFEMLVKDKIEKEDYEEVKGYDLRRLCDEVYNIYHGKKELYELLIKCYEKTKPAGFHYNLTKYPWKEIYTVNIDDLVENIYLEQECDLTVQNKLKLEVSGEKTELYKLHGCVNNPREGFVFSEEEYRELTTRTLDAKLNKFTTEIQKENVIFIGASMDEPDIHYYLKKYEEAGCKYRNNQLVFIDSKPSRFLKTVVGKLGATLIEVSNEAFLKYIGELNYQPDELEKAKIELAYYGINLLSNISKLFETPYESKLYEGYFCKWQDVYEGWTFKDSNYINAIEKLNKLLEENGNIHCFSIYGAFFSGKTCLLKQLGVFLQKKGYEVLEYRGRYLSVNSIINYIKKSANTKFVLVIDGASYYYKQIEKIFSYNIEEKELVILTASREYYHQKKKYYLEGNSYCDYKQRDRFNRDSAIAIRDKLKEKTHLSYMVAYDDAEQIREIYKQKSIANLIIQLTYGNVVKRNEEKYKKTFDCLSEMEKRLLIELAIFDIADIEFYPRELFTERYGRKIALDKDISSDVMRIVDYARMDENGLSLRNAMVENYILNQNSDRLSDIIIDILKYVSRYVSEKRNDTWYIIFQCLLKEEVLEKKLKLAHKTIDKIYFSVKGEYENISYFWLQLGLHEQKMEDFVSAYNYFEKSASIRPKSYKIQHAIARNYMRHANHISNYEKAKELFDIGEKKIKDLIESKEFNKEKAKPFSVNSYILEKIRFIYKFKLTPSLQELTYMNNAINSISITDSYKEKVYYAFYTLLENNNKLSLLKIEMGSPYMKYIGRKNELTEADFEYDIVVEDM